MWWLSGDTADPLEYVEDLTEGLESEGSGELTEPLEAGLEVELSVLDVVPVSITPDHLNVEVAGDGKRTLELRDVDALAVSLVGGLAERPVVVIDLLLNWHERDLEPLRIVRLRDDLFDAAAIMDVSFSSGDALRELLKHILAVADPTPLPDPMSVVGMPFAEFDELENYEKAVFASAEMEELDLL